MLPPLTDTVFDARELLGRPGTSRSLARRVPAPADSADALVELGPEVTIEGIVESVVDGLLVRATIRAPATVTCARCLTGYADELRTEAVELFSRPGDAVDGVAEAGYEIVDEHIDLDTLMRDALAEVTPLTPRCRPDCRGLCPVCGADRNTDPCDGHPSQADPRWSALSHLQLPDVP